MYYIIIVCIIPNYNGIFNCLSPHLDRKFHEGSHLLSVLFTTIAPALCSLSHGRDSIHICCIDKWKGQGDGSLSKVIFPKFKKMVEK